MASRRQWGGIDDLQIARLRLIRLEPWPSSTPGSRPPRCAYRRHGRSSAPANPDHVQADGDFAAPDFSSRKITENLYDFCGRICGFPKEFEGKGRNGARFFDFRSFIRILRADATPPDLRGVGKDFLVAAASPYRLAVSLFLCRFSCGFAWMVV
jgi:hypothetical protein